MVVRVAVRAVFWGVVVVVLYSLTVERPQQNQQRRFGGVVRLEAAFPAERVLALGASCTWLVSARANWAEDGVDELWGTTNCSDFRNDPVVTPCAIDMSCNAGIFAPLR